MTGFTLADLLAAVSPDPHPELAAAQTVTPSDVMHASGGLFPDRRTFTPAVPYRKD